MKANFAVMSGAAPTRNHLLQITERTCLFAGTQTATMERAAQLAEVAAAVYDKGGVAIRLPLDGDHPLVAVMSAAVRKEQVHADMHLCCLPSQQATLSCA